MRLLRLPAPGDGGENFQAMRIVEARPGGDLVYRTVTAGAQAGLRVHRADVDAGRGDHQMSMKRRC